MKYYLQSNSIYKVYHNSDISLYNYNLFHDEHKNTTVASQYIWNNPTVYVLFKVIDINVDCNLWGGLSSTTPNSSVNENTLYNVNTILIAVFTFIDWLQSYNIF